MTASAGPLSGIRVLDLSTVGPGSRCSALLADYGADVIKVGRPVGTGGIEPHWWAYGASRGTRRIRLALNDERAVEAFLSLCEKADVVLDSFRPGVVDKLGVGYDAVRARNPKIIYAALTGYGQDGPYSQWAGHDINYLATAGFLATQGRRQDGRPAMPGATVADSAGGGMHAALAICAALAGRATTGEGAYLDVSATEGVVSLMSLNVDQFLATGEEPGPDTTLLTGKNACYEIYTCSDGKFITVGAIETKFFRNLCAALDLAELAADQYVDERQDALRAALAGRFATKTRDEWVAELAHLDTCVAPVLTIAEVAANEQHRSRGVVGSARHPEHGSVEQTGAILAGARRDIGEVEAVPAEVTATAELLAEAGLSPDAIAMLERDGVAQ